MPCDSMISGRGWGTYARQRRIRKRIKKGHLASVVHPLRCPIRIYRLACVRWGVPPVTEPFSEILRFRLIAGRLQNALDIERLGKYILHRRGIAAGVNACFKRRPVERCCSFFYWENLMYKKPVFTTCTLNANSGKIIPTGNLDWCRATSVP